MIRSISPSRIENLDISLKIPKDLNTTMFNPTQEYRAVLDGLEVHIGLVRSNEQLSKVHDLRQDIYQDGMDYLLNADSSGDPLDDYSYIFYCRVGETVLASCRYTEPVNGQWESDDITQFASLVPADPDRLLQIGRLLITPEWRSKMLSEVLVWASCDWLQKNVAYDAFYAICAPALIRFYRHFGSYSVKNTRITLPGRKNKSYRIVYGYMNEITKVLHQYLSTRDWQLTYLNSCQLIPQNYNHKDNIYQRYVA